MSCWDRVCSELKPRIEDGGSGRQDVERGATIQFQSSARPDAADIGLDFIAVGEANGVSIYIACVILLRHGRDFAEEQGM